MSPVASRGKIAAIIAMVATLPAARRRGRPPEPSRILSCANSFPNTVVSVVRNASIATRRLSSACRCVCQYDASELMANAGQVVFPGGIV
jgi:hypothetical protein